MEAQARDAEISKRTLRRAKDKLGVQSRKSEMGGGWLWTLPESAPKMSKNAEDVQQKSLDTFGELGHLRETAEAQIEL